MIFAYRAVDSDGIESQGVIDGTSESEVVRELLEQKLTVLSIAKPDDTSLSHRKKFSSTRELVLSLQELVTLLESGVSISDTLDSMGAANYPADLTEKYKEIGGNIRKGVDFSVALEKSGLKTPDYFFRLARAGELIGDLAGSLRNGLNQFEYELSLKREFRGALTYPVILLGSGLFAVLLIFSLVVPKFLPMLARAEDLPILSQLVMGAGLFFNDNKFFIALVISLFIVGVVVIFRKSTAREMLFEIGSGLPVVGTWLTETDVSRWCSTLAALLESKVDLVEALSLANSGSYSPRRRACFSRTISRVQEGVALSDALEMENALTPVGYNLIRSGEKAGKVSEMVKALSRIYDESSRERMRQAMRLIEPLSILVIGVFIGGIVLGVMLAITSVNTVSF